MRLPVMPQVEPMLAKLVRSVPAADSVPGGLGYEPKWDGFRCLVYRDGEEVLLDSRGGKPITRYFPELVAAAKTELPERCVLDGEVVLAVADRLNWDLLSQRIHPAESRVRKLAGETPARFVAFDLLAVDDEDLMAQAFSERHARLADVVHTQGPSVYLTPMTLEATVAADWFGRFEGAGLDGIVAKSLAAPYQPGKRAMLKIKHERTADCVVAGYRPHKSSTPARALLGSLLLGLYTEDGELAFVGASSAFPTATRAKLIDELAPLATDVADHPWGDGPGAGTRRPGGPSRWNSGKDPSFVPLEPRRVVEVGYDHMEGDRFRHTVAFRRWRPDRDPRSCTYTQLEEVVGYDLQQLLPGA